MKEAAGWRREWIYLTSIQEAWVVALIVSLTLKIPFPSLGLSFPSVNEGG